MQVSVVADLTQPLVDQDQTVAALAVVLQAGVE
jgi:hypothetical protein